MTQAHRPIRPGSAVRGFTLIEAVISLVLVGTIMVAALGMVAMTAKSQGAGEDHTTATQLADELMAEVLSQAYEEPVGVVVFGTESGESPSTRANYDDVDDYRDWKNREVQLKDGTPIEGLDDWERCVVVDWVDPVGLTPGSSGSGVKRITVTVYRDSIPIATLQAVRTEAWMDSD